MFECYSDIIIHFISIYLEFPFTTYDTMVEVELKKN